MYFTLAGARSVLDRRDAGAHGKPSATSPQSAIKSFFSPSLLCTCARRNPESCGTNQGAQRKRFGVWQARAAYSIAETRSRMTGGEAGVLIFMIVYISFIQ